MKTSMFQADAFTGLGLAGNRAAVCLLDDWAPDELLQAIAAHNGLSETAYLVPDLDAYDLRWFTPTTEVDLCGHATLASAYVVFSHLEPGRLDVTFRTRSGALHARREGDLITLDFPARSATPVAMPAHLDDALGLCPEAVLATPLDLVAVYPSEADVRRLEPDPAMLQTFDRPGIIATAPGERYDFVSRFFAPAYGIDEDPVTGSAHCVLAPYWAGRLGRTTLAAAQLSAEGGELFLTVKGARVDIAGRVEPFLEAAIEV